MKRQVSIRVKQRATLHLTPPTLLETSPSSFTNILPSLTKLHLSPKPVTITFVSFAVSCLTSIPQLPSCTIATSIVHSKLDYCNSHYYKLSKSQLLSRLQHIQNYIARTVAKASMSCHITPILRSLHWLRINERIEYKLLSLTYKVLTTTQPPYLHNLISTQRSRSTRSLSVVTLARPPSSPSLKITDRPFRNVHLVSGINSLYLFVYLILVPVPPFPIHLFLHPLLLPFLIHYFAHP